MPNFAEILEETGEIGVVNQTFSSIIVVEGLPGAHLGEVVVCETGQKGYVLSLSPETVEVVLLSLADVMVGTRVARTNQHLQIDPTRFPLGTIRMADELEAEILVDGDTKPHSTADGAIHTPALRQIDTFDTSFASRERVKDPLTTGVSIVDLLVPLAKGQRELILGDRKTGKTNFTLQTIEHQIEKGCICLYVSIAKPHTEIQRLTKRIQDRGLDKQMVILAIPAGYRPGIVFLAPYIAMTLAEHYREQSRDVLIVLDDLTTHAQYYREMMLTAKRFPGRNSYPGDIFYIHSRLLERAGKFQQGSITCLPIAQSVMGDFSGFIQTNLMSMTDGHVFFDSDLFDQGRRPPVNIFLSVTRVGEQAQQPLVRNIGRQLRSFLTQLEKVKQFKHFQTELAENTQRLFNLGERVTVFLDQGPNQITPLPVTLLLFGTIWAEFWTDTPVDEMSQRFTQFLNQYRAKKELQDWVDKLITPITDLEQLVAAVRSAQQELFKEMQTEDKT